MGFGSKLKKLGNPFSAPGLSSITQKISAKIMPQESEDFFKNPTKQTRQNLKDADRQHRDAGSAVNDAVKGGNGNDWGLAIYSSGSAIFGAEKVATAPSILGTEVNAANRSGHEKVDKAFRPMFDKDPDPAPAGGDGGPNGAGAVNAKGLGNTAYSSTSLYEEGMLPGSINTANYKK